MAAFLYGIRVLFMKELRMILKDPRSRFILVFPVIVQTLLFGYVATYDLNKVLYALLDEDHSASSRDLAAQFDGSGIFRRVATLSNTADIASQLDGKKALVVVHIDPHFERRLLAGERVPVQALVDGRNGNVAGIAASYVSVILDAFNAKRMEKQGIVLARTVPVTRAWFNPNLETRWNIISGMLAVLALIQVMILTALSVAREKEQGTFDQLLVTPLEPMGVMLGKALPSVVVGLAQSGLVLLIALFWFRIPFGGSYLLLFTGLTLFNFALVGMGLCISALTATMQQAMLYAFSLIMPMVLLSGFATPISSMPDAVRYITYLNPARYGIELAQRIYLQGAGLAEIWQTFWPLILITVVTMGAAARLFRTRLA
ncbi:ABC transporter permease [Desulfovibrio sp. OttesenSCG-928-O18]|nr:ABC transporter permease [Desulfovibrio sp. OttesenSCG-928-O18]